MSDEALGRKNGWVRVPGGVHMHGPVGKGGGWLAANLRDRG